MMEDRWRLSVRIARNSGDLLQHRQTWGRLVERAAEPYFFYEPEPFLAAVDHLPLDEPLCVVLVYANPPERHEREPALVGFVPFQQISDRRLALLVQYSLHCHAYRFLCTPLIDLDFVPEVVGILFDWMATIPDGVRIFDLNKISSAGRIWQASRSRLSERNLPKFARGDDRRVLFRRPATPVEQVRSSIGAKRRKELRRLRDELGERGILALRVLQGDDSAEAWTDQFLTLASSG